MSNETAQATTCAECGTTLAAKQAAASQEWGSRDLCPDHLAAAQRWWRLEEQVGELEELEKLLERAYKDTDRAHRDWNAHPDHVEDTCPVCKVLGELDQQQSTIHDAIRNHEVTQTIRRKQSLCADCGRKLQPDREQRSVELHGVQVCNSCGDHRAFMRRFAKTA